MFSTSATQEHATTTVAAQALIAAFQSDTGCPKPVSIEPVDPRYAHSAALGRRQQETSHVRARRCQECTRPLPTASTSSYCATCAGSAATWFSLPAVGSEDSHEQADPASQTHALSKIQKKQETEESSKPQVNQWVDTDHYEFQHTTSSAPASAAQAPAAATVPADDENGYSVPDEWDDDED